MKIKELINKITRAGVRESYQPWEVFLTRKLNTLTLVGLFNVFITTIFFYFFGFTQLLPECLILLSIGFGVTLLNIKKNYRWAAHYFYHIGFVFFASLNLKVGLNSFLFLYYFPFIISMIQLLGRKETIKDLIVLSVFCFLSIVFVGIGHYYNWIEPIANSASVNVLSTFNLVLAFFTTFIFMIIVVMESQSQEAKIKSMLNEKEILLAEVFHRVKNNMNIVTSLLSLKKDMSSSQQVQEALDDCRNRVYSMALVHQKMYKSNNLVNLNFKDYINDLVKDIQYSLGGSKSLNVKIDAKEIHLELSNAIPCGLILNELITNAYKYAGGSKGEIDIHISLDKEAEFVKLQLRDNGPGLSEEALTKPNTLGIELIKSLSEQLDGKYHFSNNNGLVFDLVFKQA